MIKLELDERLKEAFDVGEYQLCKILNHIFDTELKSDFTYNIKNTEHHDTNEIETKRNYTDFEVVVRTPVDLQNIFHIEFQTKNYNNMGIRMFLYAQHNTKYNFEKREVTLPNQVIICITPNKNLGDTIPATIYNFGNKTIDFEVNVYKLWEHTIDEYYKEGLYTLMPFLLVMHRYKPNRERLLLDYNAINDYCNKLLEETEEIYIPEVTKLVKHIKDDARHFVAYIEDRHPGMEKILKEDDSMIIRTVEEAEKVKIQAYKDLEEARIIRRESESKLRESESKLRESESKLRESESKIRESESKIRESESRNKSLEKELKRAQKEIERLSNLLKNK